MNRLYLCFSMLLVLVLAALPIQAVPDGWLTDVDKALAEAAKTQRFILVDLYAEWCGWCKVLEKDVFNTPEFKSFGRDYVLLHVDVEDGAEGSALQARYGIANLPTTLIIDADRVRVGTITGFKPTEVFIDAINKQVSAYDKMLEAFEEVRSKGDPAAMSQMAQQLHDRGDGRRALALYEKMLKFTHEPFDTAWLHFLSADALRMSSQYETARERLKTARRIAGALPDADRLIERLHLLDFSIHQDDGHCKEAIAALESFLESYPESHFIRSARRSLMDLKRGKVECS